MNTEKYISNYDYIKNCSIEEMAEMMTTLTIEMYRALTGLDASDNFIKTNTESAMSWLKEPVVQGDYLN